MLDPTDFFEAMKRDEARSIERLRKIVFSLDVRDLVTFLVHETSLTTPETYREDMDTGYQAAAEFLFLMRLRNSRLTGTRYTQRPKAFHAALELAKKIQFYAIMPTGAGAAARLSADEAGARAHMLDTFVSSLKIIRNDSYHHFCWDLLRDLFNGFSSELQALVGFDAEQFVSLDKAFERCMTDHARRNAADFQRMRLRIRREGRSPSWRRQYALTEGQHRTLRSIRSPKERSHFEKWAAAHAVRRLDASPFAVTPPALASAAQVDLKVATAFLKFFTVDHHAVMRAPIGFLSENPLRLRPYWALAEGYVTCAPNLVRWAAKERFEEAFKAANAKSFPNLWHRYEEHRADYLEDKALELLGSVLRGGKVYKNLTYTDRSGSKEVVGELDGLILFDCVAVIVEAKSGTLNVPARRGKPDRVEERLQKLVSDPQSQVGRAANYILNNDKPAFGMPGGSVTIDKESTNMIFPVSVTLEEFGRLTAVYKFLLDGGILSTDVVPWAVSLFSLRAICEIAESPTVLLSYVRERLRMTEDVHQVGQELDWFGWFLSDGLQFDVEAPDGSALNVAMMMHGADEIDAYYLYASGLSSREVEKPRLNAPPLLHELLEEIETKVGQGYIWITSRLLGGPNGTREWLVEGIDQSAASTRRDNKPHEVSVVFPDGGVTFMTCRAFGYDRAKNLAANHGLLKKYQQKKSWWIWALKCVDWPGLVHELGTWEAPYEHDDNLERAIAPLQSTATRPLAETVHPSSRLGL